MDCAQRRLLIVASAATLLTAKALSGQQNNPTEIPFKDAETNAPIGTVTVKGVTEPVYRVHRTGTGINPPRPTYSPEPDYSNEARKRKIEGVVTLAVVITSAGQTTQIRVLTSRGYGLDEKAIEAVRKWKFKPATKDGKPVSVEIALEIDFRLYHNQ